MKLKFKFVFKKGLQTIATVTGREVNFDLDPESSRKNIAGISDKIIETEQFVEKLTGLRCHIEQVG